MLLGKAFYQKLVIVGGKDAQWYVLVHTRTKPTSLLHNIVKRTHANLAF